MNQFASTAEDYRWFWYIVMTLMGYLAIGFLRSRCRLMISSRKDTGKTQQRGAGPNSIDGLVCVFKSVETKAQGADSPVAVQQVTLLKPWSRFGAQALVGNPRRGLQAAITAGTNLIDSATLKRRLPARTSAKAGLKPCPPRIKRSQMGYQAFLLLLYPCQGGFTCVLSGGRRSGTFPGEESRGRRCRRLHLS
jgi:hypothetical protein